jgi:hypothetical protein
MNFMRILRRPTAAELVSDMIVTAEKEMEDAERQLVLATDALATATASVEFHKARLERLRSQIQQEDTL